MIPFEFSLDDFDDITCYHNGFMLFYLECYFEHFDVISLCTALLNENDTKLMNAVNLYSQDGGMSYEMYIE